MNHKDIEELVEAFFEGKTSNREEEALYGYFASGQVPEHLEKYAPIFDCLKNELHRLPRQEEDVTPRRRRTLLRVSYAAAIAASVAVVLMLTIPSPEPEPNPFEGSYMIVDGEKITDMDLLMPEIEQTLSLVTEIKRDLDAANEEIAVQARIHDEYLNQTKR